ncbi:MAG: hypothetical protein IIW83_00320 [Clostridia bacterium]|nr:hypothetical protein [Clostridia bacterium]
MDNLKDNLIPDEEISSENTEKRTLKREQIEIDESLFENSTLFGESEVKEKKKSKLSPIKKGIISISSLALLTAVVLVVVMFVIPKGGDDNETIDTSSVATKTEFEVMTVKPADIKQVTVKNDSDNFTLIPKETTDSEGNTGYAWLAKGYEHIDFTTPAYMVDAVINVKALKKFDIDEAAIVNAESDTTASDSTSSGDTESGANDPYGFSKPYSVLKVELNDGGGYKVTVGSVSPDKSGRYINISGDGDFKKHEKTAYLVDTSVINCVGNSLLNSVNMISAPAITSSGENDEYFDSGELIKFDELLIGGRLHKNTIKVICPSDDLSLLSYMIEEPNEQAANDESVNSILGIVGGVYNSGAYVLDYKNSDIKKYGLDNPYLTYYIKVGDRYIDMKISELQDDGYYAYTVNYSNDGGKTVVDKNIIYKLNAEGYEYFELKSEEIFFEKLFIEYVKYVESMSVTVSGEPTHTFTLDHEEGNEAHFTVTTEKGKEIDDDEFCYYYARLLYLTALENDDTDYAVGDDFVIKFKISYTTEGKADDEIVIYPYDKNVRRYVYKLNGNGTALVSKTLVEDLINCLEPLASGKSIGNKYAN